MTDARIRQAEHLRDQGIEGAYQHALAFESTWGDDAYRLLLAFIAQHRSASFMTEDAREWCRGKVSEPPHQRAWGHVIRRAAKAGKVVKDGYSQCKDPGQHRTPATLWRIVK